MDEGNVKQNRDDMQNLNAIKNKSRIIQIPTRHHNQGSDLPSKESPFPISNPVQMIPQKILIPGPALYLCCFLVWSCLGKAMSSAKQEQKEMMVSGGMTRC